MEKQLAKALLLRKKGNLEESNKLLLSLLKTKINDPYLNYQIAWSFDLLEKESEAIQYYERAIQYGLKGTDLEGAFIGLGSTYRAIGNYHLAEETLRKGMNQFPSNNALKVFYSMALYNLGRYSEGMEILLSLISTTSEDEDIYSYHKAILYYSDKLDRKWL